MPFIPHTKKDTEEMLGRIGVSDVEALFDEIPKTLRQTEASDLPEGMNEIQLLQHAKALAAHNTQQVCFMGAGSYEHHIPSAVWDIANRGEFLTSYTPYQAEASQGTLQVLYEFQTMIAFLTGMDVANASLYDGASALAEAVLMAVRINKKSQSNRILVVGTLHPHYQETLQTIVGNQHIELIVLPFDKNAGTTLAEHVEAYNNEDITAIVLVQPNFFGCLEPVHALTNWAHKQHIISIACVNPTSLGLLTPPGQWGESGVDIVCGEGQPLGVPMASGGPYFGFFATKMEYVRQMPGRLVGRTVDRANRPGFALTLQAREQHIRRGKATSNICTNQGLLVTAATIYMSLIGPQGLKQVALASHQHTTALVQGLCTIPGVRCLFSAPIFHEAVLTFDKPVQGILEALAAEGILGGYPLENHYPAIANALLVCATEMRTMEEIQRYIAVVKKALL